MPRYRRRAAPLLVLLASAAWAGPALDAAVAKADLHPSDPLEVKIQKTLGLLVNQQYFAPHGTPDHLPPPYDERYHLDSLRTVEQILTQKIGGYCNNYALVFSAMLGRAGVRPDDMRIVAAVNDDDLARICPAAGAPRAEHPNSGASGHVFVAVKGDSGRWRLVNTVGGEKSHQWAPWSKPADVEAQMRSGPLAVPSKAAHGTPYKPMTVFAVWRSDAEPLHTFEQRLNLIASGTLDGKLCRYGPRKPAASELTPEQVRPFGQDDRSDVGDEDVLDLGVEIESLQAQLAADAGGLVAAEGRFQVDAGAGVDRDDARLQRARDAQDAADVASP